MSEEQVDVEYISIHGYIWNIPSDTEVLARIPAESRQEYLTNGNEYIEPCKGRQDEGSRRKRGELVGLDLPLVGGGTEAEVQIATLGQLFGTKGKHLRLRVKQLICDSLNEMRITQTIFSAATGMWVPQKAQSLEAGSYRLWSNLRVRPAIDCMQTAPRDMTGETVVANACERKSGKLHARRYC